jgi:hypothetical protein
MLVVGVVIRGREQLRVMRSYGVLSIGMRSVVCVPKFTMLFADFMAN